MLFEYCHKVNVIILVLCRDAGISAVAFHPNRRAAVSSSYGGDFKVIYG